MDSSVILANLRDHAIDFSSGFQVGESKVRNVRASLGETGPPKHRPEPVSTQEDERENERRRSILVSMYLLQTEGSG